MADEKTLDLILRQARSHGDFTDRPVPEEALRAAHDLMKWGPTSANSQPMRILYLRSKESREKLRPALCADQPGEDACRRRWSRWSPTTRASGSTCRACSTTRRRSTGSRTRARTPRSPRSATAPCRAPTSCSRCARSASTAARCPGFDNAKADAAFFPDGRLKSNFLVNIGFGTGKGLPPRNPRFTFEEACRII